MTRKRRRLIVVVLGMLCLGTAAALVLTAFEDNLVFFHSPTDVIEREIANDRPFRLGGLVEEASVNRLADGVTVQFRVTDLANGVPVVFSGVLPALFREGQGVVAEGRLRPDGVFEAREILARHDENYMPAEVADALKRAGVWQHYQEQAGEPGS